MRDQAKGTLKVVTIIIAVIAAVALVVVVVNYVFDTHNSKDNPSDSDTLEKTGVLIESTHTEGTWGQAECWELTFEDGSTVTTYFNEVFQPGKTYNVFSTKSGLFYIRLPSDYRGNPILL